MQESARKRRHYRKRYFRRNRTTIKQYKSILRENREDKETRDT